MHESVRDGRRGSGVVKELPSLLEGEVRGDDGRCALAALVEDLVEQVRSARVEEVSADIQTGTA
jgi:hypothetical protein